MIEEVFCKYCEYCRKYPNIMALDPESWKAIMGCYHPSNRKKVKVDWYEDKSTHLQKPSEINKNNDCQNFKRRVDNVKR